MSVIRETVLSAAFDERLMLNAAVSVAEMLLCGLTIFLLVAFRRVDRRTRYYYLAFLIVLLAYLSSNLVGQLLGRNPGPKDRLLLELANYGEFIFAGTLAYVGARYMLSRVDPEGRMIWTRWGFVLLLILHLLLVNASLFTKWLYDYDAAGRYQRGRLYFLSLICPGLSLLGSAALLFTHWDRFIKRERIAFSVYLLAPLAAVAAQSFIYGIYLVVHATTVATLAMCVFVLADQTEQYYSKEREAEKLKVSLMMSQIQPHFLYNSLGTIQALCRSDPRTAEQAVGEFSQFLRHNMKSIETDQPILFLQELNHAKNYLALQKLRFGDDLNIVYDLECETFSLPTLTLQPLVENAVTHGIRQTESGRGTVTIRTREMEDHYELSVIDDGVGFDPQAPTATGKGSHIALPNIRSRLARVCGGSLRIVSAPGMGCTAAILIPKAAPAPAAGKGKRGKARR